MVEAVECDVCVVGAGSGGCAVAGTLADAGLTVVLLEDGGAGHSPLVTAPGGMLFLLGRPASDHMYRGEPDASRGGAITLWSAGRMVGGSSAVNGMVYARGRAADFDGWDVAGWDGAKVAAAYRRLETVTWPAPAAERGGQGPVKVSVSRAKHQLTEAFRHACAEAGLAAINDINLAQDSAVGHAQFTQSNGARWSAADAFLRPRSNLRVEPNARALTLDLADGRCTGVIFRQDGRTRRVAVRRGVVVAAGTFGSPSLLMRSGIGPGDVLQAAGVPVRVESPSVGMNFHDHVGVQASRVATVPTWNQRLTPWLMAFDALRWLVLRDGPASASPVQVMAYARSDPALAEPDLQLQAGPVGYQPGRQPFGLAASPALTTQISLTRPKSRGRLTITRPDPDAPPKITYPSLADSADLASLVAGLRLVRRMYAQPALARLCGDERYPGQDCTSDEQLAAYVRAGGFTAYHPVGTCRMGDDHAAVVDGRCQLRGVDGLWVADASVIPRLTSSNTNAPVMMIGLRAAEMMVSG